MPHVSRINPLNISPGSGVDAEDYSGRPVQSITMGVRIGDVQSVAIGYVQSFTWSIARSSTELYQIEPVADGTFTGKLTLQGTPEFLKSKYWPGEVIEVIPGKQGAASLSLSRATLYGSNLLSALMYLQGAGNVGNDVAGTEKSTPLDFTAAGIAAFQQFVTIVQQVRPIYIKQIFMNPITGGLAYGRVFEDCWIEDLRENLPEASENRIVIEEMTLKATRIRPIDTASYSALPS